ncbi:NAD(P)-dependent dehydrogenase (short-subunit alcohol dehydrogenase family) [Rhizobium sp. BK529]|uniref:SDR family oxidoreductase n=1 Tax=unclassified Rhizobium TaxID=2613769 RepID=UPI0010430272|nr:MULTISPECIES: SDR family oxidoreductase [unclassified Rhizobium]MBB3594992.1 NAD(P)-dependent dehydrogenase (short-subunit alcohol dehydrogenase family) [Rhizobium sp. BK529]TCR98748.1 NAD(P)-dependent dehydrogenase (short-subunit alcohol dehydrogenase family) [Rhizobium sp. BK418]
MTLLKDQRVLVIGGSSGIGLAVAEAAVAAGAHVTIASRSQDKLLAAIEKLGPGTDSAVLDTTDEPSLQSFFVSRKAFDHVVVSAAQTPTGPLRKLALADAQAAMESKFWGAYRVARAARIAERGSLTLISGYLSERPSASSVLQGAINAALEGLARGLALEFSPVRVNTVSPGLIDTPLWSKMADDAKAAMFSRVSENLPAKTIGKPEHIAKAVLFLMTTPFATGSNVRVDGGGAIA